MLSRAAKLSKTYTNHCIGAVSIATLNSVAGIGSKLAPLHVAPEMVNGSQRLRRDTEDSPDLETRKMCKRQRTDIYSAYATLPESSPKRLCVRPGVEGANPPVPIKVSADSAVPVAPPALEHKGEPALVLSAQVITTSGVIQNKYSQRDEIVVNWCTLRRSHVATRLLSQCRLVF